MQWYSYSHCACPSLFVSNSWSCSSMSHRSMTAAGWAPTAEVQMVDRDLSFLDLGQRQGYSRSHFSSWASGAYPLTMASGSHGHQGPNPLFESSWWLRLHKLDRKPANWTPRPIRSHCWCTFQICLYQGSQRRLFLLQLAFHLRHPFSPDKRVPQVYRLLHLRNSHLFLTPKASEL